jgi:hypothetical protein
MTNRQRMKNDSATEDRREMADKARRENRIRSDRLTKERRDNADKNMREKRLRNDEMTSHRRKINDRNPWRTLAISLLLLVILAIGAYYFLFLR